MVIEFVNERGRMKPERESKMVKGRRREEEEGGSKEEEEGGKKE